MEHDPLDSVHAEQPRLDSRSQHTLAELAKEKARERRAHPMPGQKWINPKRPPGNVMRFPCAACGQPLEAGTFRRDAAGTRLVHRKCPTAAEKSERRKAQ